MRSIQRFSYGRRTFLRQAGAAALAPWVLPASVWGATGVTAPSSRIRLGFLGVGMMGRGHLNAFLHNPETQVVALCDVDRWRRETAQANVEKTYAADKASGVYRGCAVYVDLREFFAHKDLDAVLIATGERWHPTATVMAAQAGLDIYVEKPTSLTIAENRAMVEGVRRYGRVCQVGLQQRSTPEFRLACQLVRDGALGKIERIFTDHNSAAVEVDLPAEPTPESLEWDLWLGPAPWRPFHHRFHYLGQPLNVVPWEFCRDFGGGGLNSGGVHAFDIVQWALNQDQSGPVAITPPETGKVPHLTYEYANGTLLHVVDGRVEKKKYPLPAGWDEATIVKPFGALFVGQRGWIHVGREGYLTSFPAEIVKDYPSHYDRLLVTRGHHNDWLHAIRTRERPAADVAIGCQSTILCHLGNIARWTKRPLRWDPAREEFLGDDEANRLRRRAMREPWQI